MKVAEAVTDEMIQGYRRHNVPRADLTPLGDFLDAVAAGNFKLEVGGDQIISSGPVATHDSAVSIGNGIAVAGKGHNVIAGTEGDVLMPGSVKHVYPDPAKAAQEAEERALRCYLERLYRYCEALPLASLGGDETGDQDVTLDQVYIDLNTTTAGSPYHGRRSALARNATRLCFWAARRCRRPLTALEAAAAAPRLVLLGDPGAGKSTFARLMLAQLCDAQLGRGDPPPGVSTELLPILVTLRELTGRLAALQLGVASEERQRAALASAVRDHVLTDLTRFDAADCAAPLRSALVDGRCLLVLDGLDEVPQGLRKRVRSAVAAVIAAYAPKRIVVTCRVRSYVGDAVLPGFQSHTLAPFDEDRIRRFVQAWYGAQQHLGRFDATQVENRIADLTAAALGPDLVELAGNPMLLTTMAIIHQKEIGLPRERVRLYSLAVDVLLRRWQKRKTGEQSMAPSAGLTDFFKDDLRLRSAMERLAYEAHSRGLRPGEAAELTRGAALELLANREYLGSAGLADEFLDYVDQRAGLLVGRGGDLGQPTTYAFPHRTFQEYLAGCYLAGQRDMARAYFAHAREADWRLAAQLGSEELLYNLRRPNELLDLAYRLCPANQPDGLQARRADLWSGAMAVLAGRGAIEHDAGSPDGGGAYLGRLLPRLVDLLGSDLPAPERADAGKLLGKLGDPRPGATILDDMQFCLVPAGRFWLGSDKKRDPDSDDDERPCKQVDLPLYYVSRYPVTNAQYGVFVASGGYAGARFWAEAQAAGYWNKGQFQGRWDDAPRAGPYELGEPFNLPNHPVVGVSWYEALAFTRWLTKRWSASGRLPANWAVALPTERQWEKAARGGLEIPVAPSVSPLDGRSEAAPCEMQPNPDPRRIYPWLGKPTPDHANYGESRIGATSAVGVFTRGGSPYGALDMSGNVWEWCQTKWRGDYKREPDDNPEGDKDRVLRGGSFVGDAWDVRCAVRDGVDPYVRGWNFGFRVVASPIIHDSGR